MLYDIYNINTGIYFNLMKKVYCLCAVFVTFCILMATTIPMNKKNINKNSYMSWKHAYKNLGSWVETLFSEYNNSEQDYYSNAETTCN